MPTIWQRLRQHTHWELNEQGLYTCTPTASMFVCFFLKVHHPPLESNESHAGAATLNVCHRGEAPGPGLESPITTQSPRERISPDQWHRKGKCPPSISMLLYNPTDSVSHRHKCSCCSGAFCCQVSVQKSKKKEKKKKAEIHCKYVLV